MLVTLPFNGTVSAGGELVLCSKQIRQPFRLHNIQASFALGQNRTCRLKVFISGDNSTPAAGQPSGRDILSEYIEDTYLTGDDETKSFPMQTESPDGGQYIKAYANNTDAFNHAVDVLITIETPLPVAI